MGLTPEQKEKEELAILEVNRRRKYFQDTPFHVECLGETIDNILLGMKFQATNINYVTNTVTFTLVE